MLVGRACTTSLVVRHTLHALQFSGKEAIRAILNPFRYLGIAGPPCGGLYLMPPSSGGLCEGVMTMPSASPDVLSPL
jgi:hypothetical protein